MDLFATAELETRSKPGASLTQGFLHQLESRIIRVALPGPEEAFKSILVMTRHEVNMYMGDALTDAVVDGHKRPICG